MGWWCRQKQRCTETTLPFSLHHSPTTWLYTLYRGSRMNWTNERGTSPREEGGLRLKARVSSWNQMSPHNRRANSLRVHKGWGQTC
jgi:hypothetical protein